ncbi:peptide synthase [Mycobacterium intermedium]|uniref:Peptide synthase n=1 Tax=Mycobacterium intermedium TaxID=28445 RepID=A0A1E3SAY0_MYCIE|nr:AMP-binding protein [Mycobacterium intermedium]MCV6967393.1 AMP-binding protein [Mycobacterium intermedium]ODQ99244.1 peptide synthase [Mycobacterium intermedium]ORB05928.1 peptide synthase [Mycobacterium intermedium]
MSTAEAWADRIPLSRSQQNLYNGVLQDGDPSLYLIGKKYRFHPLPLPGFLAALEATVCENPVQLCVLEAPTSGEDYPDLVARLQFGDIVRVRAGDQVHAADGDFELQRTWASGILDTALVRYTVWTDERGDVSGLDVHAHHIVVDGGATGIIEADLARHLAYHLAAGETYQSLTPTAGLVKLAEAHRRERAKVEESLGRVADAVQRELTEDARLGAPGQGASGASGAAAKGVLRETVTVSGDAFDAILRLSESEQVPLNVLVATAALAVDASMRQSTETLLVHAVDNRFADPALNVATCLVNSVAHPVRFAPFASVRDVVRTVDRGYVKAVRRRWLREEHYRRMYLAINRTAHVEALTLNFIRETCAPALRPFLIEAPLATDIGPVEGMTVATVLDEEQRALNLAIWDRADLPEPTTAPRVADRIAAALEAIVRLWDQPIAMAVNDWIRVGSDGAVDRTDAFETATPPAPAWFVDAASRVDQMLTRRPAIHRWVAWLVQNGSTPGDVIVLTDDNTDKTVDCLIACHLAGCGYSICDTSDQLPLRANAIAEHVGDVTARVVDVAAVRLPEALDDDLSALANERIRQVAQDPSLGAKTAYVMPTSGSTGQPKLVRVPHGSLALFCAAVTEAYGWGPHDTVLQCAPLTSDISVEEIFGAAFCGAELVRTTAMKAGDFDWLARDLVDADATVVDLPTAVWHLLCEDHNAMDAIGQSRLRQIVIGGEAIRSAAVDKWLDSAAAPGVSLMSSYGPTETTVVVTYLPITGDGVTVTPAARLRLGRPIVPDTVFLAFGEVVIVGDLVSEGYLGIDDSNFGTVTTSDGSRLRAFATADRVILDDDGFPLFAGRKDDVVKVSGKRVDIAEIAKRISAAPAVSDVAVELHNARLGVWFETARTREATEDAETAARIRQILLSSGVSSFFVVGVPNIPRKPNGKVDSDQLRTMPQLADAVRADSETDEKAVGLAQLWSRHLGTVIQPGSSLLGAGIGSLDLIRILPDTRRILGQPVSILDLISADTAANLVADMAAATTADAWMDSDTATQIARDLDGVRAPAARVEPGRGSAGAVLVLGASGILGTGFAGAILDLKRSGVRCPDVVLAARSAPSERDPWAALRDVDGVRVQRLPVDFGAADVDTLLSDCNAGTVINCIGNTNVLVPYRDLRPANVELVSALVDVCANRGVRLVHLSTFVVGADVTAPQVTDPRNAPYPYAASKSLAELVVAGAAEALDFTIVRLPRVLGEDYQLCDSADILVSVADACTALGAYPALTLTEEVTTGRAVAAAILGLVPEVSGASELGRGITVARGEAVDYAGLLSKFGPDELDVTQWKRRLDDSDWAKSNPRRWSVVDGWVSLGMRMGARSYTEYLADYPTLPLGVATVTELATPTPPIAALLAQLFQTV